MKSSRGAGSRQIKRSQARAVCPSLIPERVRFWTAQDPVPSCRRNTEVRAKALFPTRGRSFVASAKQKPATGPFAPQLTAGSRRGKNAATTRPLCISGAIRTAGPAINGVLALAGVCVCVSVWMYRLSKLSGQCHRRSLQLVCLSGLVQLSVLPVSPAVLSAAWLGKRCARPDGMLLCRSRRPLPSCRRRAQGDMHGWHSCHTHTELACRASHGQQA